MGEPPELASETSDRKGNLRHIFALRPPRLCGSFFDRYGEDFKLVPLTSFEFENLALKINRLNLGSPDFSDDWRVLKLDTLGARVPARKY